MQSMLLSAAIGFAITLITSLIALWTMEGVTSFSDISSISYAVAAGGAIVGALKDVQAQKATPPT
ncbi:MAG: hypothetical protein ACR2PR_06020 [Pseudohongiellaceae bacterium]